MTFAQRRNRITTNFSESIPVVKRRISVLVLCWRIFRASVATAGTDVLITLTLPKIFTKYVLPLHEDIFICLALSALCSPFCMLLFAAEMNYFSSRYVSLVYFPLIVLRHQE